VSTINYPFKPRTKKVLLIPKPNKGRKTQDTPVSQQTGL